MTEKEVKELIPKYVFGQLGEPLFSIVEDSLNKYPSLSEEVRFWRAFAWATNLHQLPDNESHPPAECLDDYARGAYPQDSQLREPFERHLAECAQCRRRLTGLRTSSEHGLVRHRGVVFSDADRRPRSEKPCSTLGELRAKPFPTNTRWLILAIVATFVGVVIVIAEYFSK